jgi:hypothetical protein
MKQHPVLDNRFLVSKYMQPLLSNVFANKRVPVEMIGVQQFKVFSMRPCHDVIRRTIGGRVESYNRVCEEKT